MVVQKDAGTSSTFLWVGALLHDQHTETVTVDVELQADAGPTRVLGPAALYWYCLDSERAVTGWAAGTRFFHAHIPVSGLTPDSWYSVSVSLREQALHARCQARTLPAGLVEGRPLTIFTASCYDVDTDSENQLDTAYRRLLTAQRSADLTWLTGDAVYADAPWWLYATMARATPRSYLLLEYWSAWGCSAAAATARRSPACGVCSPTDRTGSCPTTTSSGTTGRTRP